MSLATAPPPTLVEQQTELFRELNAVLVSASTRRRYPVDPEPETSPQPTDILGGLARTQ